MVGTENHSLGTALPAEMKRVRDEVIPAYLEIGPSGALALELMRFALDRATKALAEGDLPTMILAYQDLQGFQT